LKPQNTAQIEYWNGRAGEKWSTMQTALDVMLAPATAELKMRVGNVAGQRVLDIGCGTGETCLIWLSGGATVTGVDVSAPMLALAEDRTKGRAELIKADASQWKSNTPFDLAVSRFGVMFFDDPVQAFTTIAGNIRAGGRLIFACWRQLKENAWVTTPMEAIRDLLPDSPPPEPHAPGPFGLADKERLHGILEHAGFEKVSIEPRDIEVCLADEGGIDAAVRFITQIGPSGAALAEATNETRAIAAARLRAVLLPHEKNDRVTLGGAVWIVDAIKRW
jgi:SAM-dependent methyltransferase